MAGVPLALGGGGVGAGPSPLGVGHQYITSITDIDTSQTAEYGTFCQDLRCRKPKQFIFRCTKSFLGKEKCLQAMLRCALGVGH